MKASKYLYDSTLSYRNPINPAADAKKEGKVVFDGGASRLAFLHNQYYPFTFDFNPTTYSDASCTSYPCPGSNHPGLWEIPMTFLVDPEGELCRYGDNCQHQPEDEAEMLLFFQTNLYRSMKHRGNRAPVMFSFGAKWYQ